MYNFLSGWPMENGEARELEKRDGVLGDRTLRL